MNLTKTSARKKAKPLKGGIWVSLKDTWHLATMQISVKESEGFPTVLNPLKDCIYHFRVWYY